ncbi:MAG: hypothetical protein CTY19_06000 [Methylomonas sp.]|nr:MAG: hypothetical protein CTY19_06000 [Methylomonas sp.]
MPTSEALKMEIAAGKNSGSGISAEIVFARLEAKYEQQAKSIFFNEIACNQLQLQKDAES